VRRLPSPSPPSVVIPRLVRGTYLSTARETTHDHPSARNDRRPCGL